MMKERKKKVMKKETGREGVIHELSFVSAISANKFVSGSTNYQKSAF